MYNRNKIVFVGNMRTLQNQDAVKYFVRAVFPIVLNEQPDARLYIIGAEPSDEIKKLDNGKNITVSGYVDSIQDTIYDASVAVAPVRIAAGIQNKVLIAMACKIPVVVTPLIKDGIPELVSGNNCFIADGDTAFAHAVVSCIRDFDLRNRIALAGYDLVKKSYSWNQKLDGYEQLSFA